MSLTPTSLPPVPPGWDEAKRAELRQARAVACTAVERVLPRVSDPAVADTVRAVCLALRAWLAGEQGDEALEAVLRATKALATSCEARRPAWRPDQATWAVICRAWRDIMVLRAAAYASRTDACAVALVSETTAYVDRVTYWEEAA